MDFFPEIHIVGEFRPDISAGWIPTKNNLLETNSIVLDLLSDGGDESTLFESQVAIGEANLDTKNIDQTYESVNLISAELLDGLEELEKVLNDEYGNRPTELSTKEGFFIRLYFDKSDRKYRIGEIISGKVIVRTFGEFKIEWLGLVYQWRTHGRVELEEGELNQIIVSENEKWRVGQLYEYSFSFFIDEGPPTYRGHNHNLDWYIRPELKTEKGRSDSNYILDILKAAETEFLLVPENEAVKIEIDTPSVNDRLLKIDWVRVPYSAAWFFFVSAVLVSISGIIFGTFLAIDEQISWWAWLILSGLSLLPLYWVFNETTSYKLAELRTGPVEIQIFPLDSTNGIQSRIQFQPRKNIYVDRLMMKLVVKYKISYTEGSRTVTREKTLFSRSDVNNIKQDLVKGTMFDSELKISDIPINVPTWYTGIDGIRWTIRITIIIDKWYDWIRDIPIKVSR